MSQSTNTKPTIAFFGATGGVTNACLVHTLKAGHHVVALVRTPSKLRQQLVSQSLDESIIDSQLTILQGNARDVASVKSTLLIAAPGTLPSLIISGLGASPTFHFNGINPLNWMSIDQPSLCGDGAQTQITALQEIYNEQPALKAHKPSLMFVSTTGITRGPEDVPWSLRYLYHTILAVPHIDKRKMEEIYRGNAGPVLKAVVGIRPTLLMGAANYTDAVGLEKVRVGTEEQPALGWTIKRADVGHWMFKNVVAEAETKKWEGQMFSLAQ